jgi:hypothetical protein
MTRTRAQTSTMSVKRARIDAASPPVKKTCL